MSYQFGDSTPSSLTSNVLELLRDATDFGVFALQADHAIARGHERIRELRAAAKADLGRLDGFVSAVQKSIRDEDKGPEASAAQQCAAKLEAIVANAHRSTMQEAEQRLAAAIAEVEAEEAATRQAVRNALGIMLGQRDGAEAKRVVHLVQREDGKYGAKLAPTSMLGIEWAFDLAIPDKSRFREPVRLDAFEKTIEIQVPQVTGFISKEVKVKPLRIERHLVTEVRDDGEVVIVKLQAEAPATGGFELKADLRGRKVKLARTGAAEEGATGAFDVHADDVPTLLRVAEKVHAAMESLRGGTLTKATFDGKELVALPAFREVVERLVTYLAPIVKEIADRSLMPSELVIRRSLGSDRREEIFVPKSMIRDKWAALPPELASVFRPLGLDDPSRPRRASDAPPEEPTVVRAQLAPSVPPPAPGATGRVTTARPPASAVPPPAGVKLGEEILEVDDAIEEVTQS